MRRWQILPSIFVLLLVCDEVTAGDREDVLATMDAIKTAWTSGDVDTAQKHFLPKVDNFDIDGGLLSPMGFDDARAAFAAGLKFKLQLIHNDVRVYGDTGILRGYQVRQVTPPGGTPINMTIRVSVVFVKQKDQWKVAHWHASHLTPPNPK